MAKFSIDIGFNKNLLPHPSTSLAALLSQGITEVNKEGNPVAVARTLKTGDRICLAAYDLTQFLELDPPPIQAMSAEVFFSAAIDGQESSPFEAESKLSTFKIYSYGHHGSTVFVPGGFPSWMINYDNTGTDFPDNQLESGSIPHPNYFEVVHAGHFYYTIQLTVTWGSEMPKYFRVDPEMITTTDGTQS